MKTLKHWALLLVSALAMSMLVPDDSLARKRRSDYCEACSRSPSGKIKRSESAKRQFMRQTGNPNGRKGYVIDHVVPLKRGGRDSPENMQWQTIEEARQKDKWE